MAATRDGKLRERLVNIDRSILRVPTLAIHLDRTVNSEGFKFNTELQLNPILATELMEAKKSEWVEAERTEKPSLLPSSSMHKSLSDALKRMAKAEEEDIIGLDLCLYDVQKASLGGIHSEFIQSARLDNLFMSFCGLKAMIDCASSIEKDLNIRMLALFDNEEVGSESAAGAESTLVGSTITRVLGAFNADVNITDYYITSFLDSIGCCISKKFPSQCRYGTCSSSQLFVHHLAILANTHRDKHDECHRPAMHKGIVLKYNSNQRYCTNSRSAAFIKQLAAKAGIPLQEFMVRNDSPCGSTIGPILSAQLGLQAVDVGAPQLSMHSIREMAGVEDIANSINLFSAFYENSANISSVRTLDCLD